MTNAVTDPVRDAPVLEVRGVTKSFGGARALRGVDFTLRRGEVHALLGENGAGKTTLMNILSGAIAPDDGDLSINGETVRFDDPREAQAAGIATIIQELDLVPTLDVAANLFLGHERRAAMAFSTRRRCGDEARKRLSAIDVDIDVDRRVDDLSVGHRQMVAIVKALPSASRDPDHGRADRRPNLRGGGTAVRSHARSRAKGVGIVYISHRIEEVPHVADRVTVMRDGLIAGETAPNAPQAEIVQLLVGRPLGELFPKHAGDPGSRLLNLDRARFRLRRGRAGWQAPEDVTLNVHAGEIVGLAGVMGAGRTELLSALYGTGLGAKWEGVVEVDGRPTKLQSIRAARRAGVAFVTDDRRGSGLMLRESGRPQSHHVDHARRSFAAVLHVAAARERARRGERFKRSTSARATPAIAAARCRAATSRKWCSPRKSSASRGCCCSTSRRAASTSAPRARSTPACASLAERRARRACRVKRNAGACLAFAIASSSCEAGGQ